MNQFKRAQVVMLPINSGICSIIKNVNGRGRQLYQATKNYYYTKAYLEVEEFEAYELYITSDDEIKEGDWYFDGTDFIHKKSKHNNTLVDGNKQAKKIIATTDTSSINIRQMTFMDEATEWIYDIPQPSQQFIEKYIEEYNNGNIITDIEVEYSPSSITIQTYSEQQINDNLKALTLKINPKDNTITIKKLKDSWNREEVIEQMWSAYKASNTVFEDESALRIEFDNWINQKL